MGNAQVSGWAANGNQYFIPGWNETCQWDGDNSGGEVDPFLEMFADGLSGGAYDSGKMTGEAINALLGHDGEYKIREDFYNFVCEYWTTHQACHVEP
jgi:hypothetical protein